MKANAILIRGTNRTKLWAIDMTVRHCQIVYPQLEFYSIYPTKLKSTPLLVWDGQEEAIFYYNTNKPKIKEWSLIITSIIHEKMNDIDFPYFKAPLKLNKFTAIKSIKY